MGSHYKELYIMGQYSDENVVSICKGGISCEEHWYKNRDGKLRND